MGDEQRVSGSITVAARPDEVYALVSDLPRMGEWSPENTGGRWVGGATGPAPGARFRGTNRNGRRRWATVVTVTEATPPTRFAFRLLVGRKPVVEWAYDIRPTDGGCELTETWTCWEGPLLLALGWIFSGVRDRAAHTKTMIEKTLAGVKRTAEAGRPSPSEPASG
jgi:hypothetical protein